MLDQASLSAFRDELSKIAQFIPFEALAKEAAMIRGVRGAMPMFGEAVKDVKGGISGVAKAIDPKDAARALVHGRPAAAPAAAAKPLMAAASKRPTPPPLPGRGMFAQPAVPSPFSPR